MKVFALLLAAIVTVVAVSDEAQARRGRQCQYPYCPGDAPATISALSSFTRTFINTISSFGSVMTATATKATAQIQGELQKSSVARIQAAGAIESHAISLEMKKDSAEVLESARIPQSACSNLDTITAKKETQRDGRADIIRGSGNVVNYMSAGDQSVAARLREISLDRYASDSDAKRLNIERGERPAWDIDAQYLFGGQNSEPRFAEDQMHAINLMISRQTMLVAPQPLMNTKTPGFDFYEESRKRYISLTSTAKAAKLFIASGYQK